MCTLMPTWGVGEGDGVGGGGGSEVKKWQSHTHYTHSDVLYIREAYEQLHSQGARSHPQAAYYSPGHLSLHSSTVSKLFPFP